MEKIYVNYSKTGINTIRGIAWTILTLGIIASVILFFSICVTTVERGSYVTHTEILFSWTGFVDVLLVLCATLFATGVCLLLGYLGQCAYVARKQHEILLAEKSIEIVLKEEPTVEIRNKQNGIISIETISQFEELKKENGDIYEVTKYN